MVAIGVVAAIGGLDTFRAFRLLNLSSSQQTDLAQSEDFLPKQVYAAAAAKLRNGTIITCGGRGIHIGPGYNSCLYIHPDTFRQRAGPDLPVPILKHAMLNYQGSLCIVC